MKTYIILESSSKALLESEVNKKMEFGYEPIGGVGFSEVSTPATYRINYVQAMILRIK